MEEDDAACAACRRRHQRRAVGEVCPGPLDEIGGRFGQDLPLDEDIGGAGHARKGAVQWIIGERLRLGPGKCPAKRPLALPKRHGHKRIVGGRGGKPRAGETDQCAAVVDPFRKQRIGLFRQAADIGHDEDRRPLLQEFRNGDREIGFARLDEVGIGASARLM